jgi:penicillin-binding protein-related factor A (putative recombinase)
MKGRLAKDVQATYGDLFVQTKDDAFFTIELKAEEANRHGNFFLEEWSNRSRYRRGWMDSLNVCYLLYHFVESDQLYIIDFQALKKWAYWCEFEGQPRLYAFPMKQQGKRDQLNDTWGACVPIEVIQREVGLRLRRPSMFEREAA